MPGMSIWNSSIKCWLFLDIYYILHLLHYLNWRKNETTGGKGEKSVVSSPFKNEKKIENAGVIIYSTKILLKYLKAKEVAAKILLK